MNSVLAVIGKMLITIPSTITIWLVSFFAFEHSFFASSVISLTGGLLVFGIMSVFLKRRLLKRHRLSRKEFHYIMNNLDEAKRKIYRLNRALVSIKHLPSLKQRLELIRITRKIYSMSKKEPKRFYKAERFYYSHLDSAVELAEKYVFLSSQPKKNRELDMSLYETRRTLEELTHSIENDLYQFLSDDIDQLNYEIDVAKHSIKTIKDSSKISDESRRLK
ncbi:5-bromo-4-chloroindolyl phosphate hydrolysis family protein [Cytobacillus sp. S13-E01]|uniref:5-bromo-4-chloroindolyl phosphate hydrolysis family protein n=1 Tax=Cytobacillus sp. S13-E01 TaxID=3031326 RepID=UPI0023D86C89|nr:5-bromo-4-chloroindolyl phosphate hydrolysis family protein [Cytobacillus sp. S13-E01]MDF0725847.1 5-bromo-4-chloroindolyl phosphate hydrolysis family protein [Cytobacillus sp. S13-E01]